MLLRQNRGKEHTMLKTIAFAALAVVTLVTGTVSGQSEALAQKWVETKGIVLPTEYFCRRPVTNVRYQCSKDEFDRLYRSGPSQADILRKEKEEKKKKELALRRQQEMDAEARAYKKMKEDRQRNAPTTEHCFMKNGKLECKAVR